MYVTSVQVDIREGQQDAADASLHSDFIPAIKNLPGFVKGMWFGDHRTGNATLVFDNREHAEGAITNMPSAPQSLISMRNAMVYELKAEA